MTDTIPQIDDMVGTYTNMPEPAMFAPDGVDGHPCHKSMNELKDICLHVEVDPVDEHYSDIAKVMFSLLDVDVVKRMISLDMAFDRRMLNIVVHNNLIDILKVLHESGIDCTYDGVSCEYLPDYEETVDFLKEIGKFNTLATVNPPTTVTNKQFTEYCMTQTFAAHIEAGETMLFREAFDTFELPVIHRLQELVIAFPHIGSFTDNMIWAAIANNSLDILKYLHECNYDIKYIVGDVPIGSDFTDMRNWLHEHGTD